MTWVSNIKQHVLTSYYWISDHDFMHTLIHHYMHYAVYIILTFILTATTPGTTINFAIASFRYVTSSLTCFRARRERAISRKSTRLYTNSDTYARIRSVHSYIAFAIIKLQKRCIQHTVQTIGQSRSREIRTHVVLYFTTGHHSGTRHQKKRQAENKWYVLKGHDENLASCFTCTPSSG
jgi:hypothetical protein